MKFILNEFPLPPTVNKCYPSNKKGRRFKSKELNEFISEANIWSLSRYRLLEQIHKYFMKEVHLNKWIQVNMYIHIKPTDLFTKKGKLKKIDASNRIKPAHDKLSELINIDDKHFTVGKSEFILSDKNQITFVLISSKIKSELDIANEIEQT